jgi:signal transduction histidine kinase
MTQPDDFSTTFARAGYGACMWKWVFVPDLQPALLGVFWHIPRNFAVEEIALFSALADILAVIDETARLRQASADRAIVQERRRLARDLHDSVTQSLHSLVLSAETAQQASVTKPEQLNRILGHLVNSGRQALREMRLLLFELRLVTPFDIGLVEALTRRLEAVEHRAGITAKISVSDGAIWPLRWEKQLYPVAMEALNNSLKHAHASLVEVRFQSAEGQFEMQIVDNGCGFDPQNNTSDGMGLVTMRERAESIHARLEVFSQPNQGTRISLLIPNGEPFPPLVS